jgi:hypothetical protein
MHARGAVLAVGALVALAGCTGTRDSPRTQQATTTTVAATTTTTTTVAATTTTTPARARELGKTLPLEVHDGAWKARAKITLLAFTNNALIGAYRNDPESAPRRGFR